MEEKSFWEKELERVDKKFHRANFLIGWLVGALSGHIGAEAAEAMLKRGEEAIEKDPVLRDIYL